MQITLPQDKRILIGGAVALVVLLVLIIFISRAPDNAARPDQEFNITAFGTLPDLNQAMRDNSRINTLVQKLLSYDEAFIFVNYRQVNNDMAQLLFEWAGLRQSDVEKMGAQRAIATFLRRAYRLPADEPIMNNPLLEDNPWGDLFNRFKAQILMQGHGHKIYDGLAYYDNELDRMVIQATLSEDFMTGFTDFVKTQNAEDRRKFANNLLLFLKHTKGLNNMTPEEKEMIQDLKGSSK